MDRNRNKFARPTRSMAARSAATVSDISGVYDNVSRKNQRRGGSSKERNGGSRSRSRDRSRNGGNRNDAKSTQSPKDRLLGRDAKGRQQSCKIPTGGRRQPRTKDEKRSINPSERTVDDPSDRSDTETRAESHYDSAKPRTSNAKTDRTQLHLHEVVKERSVLERMKNFYARRKALCLVLLGFAVVAIVGVIIVGIVLGIQRTTTTDEVPTATTSETYRGKVRTVSSRCGIPFPGNAYRYYEAGCVFGSPPSTESCFVGDCTLLYTDLKITVLVTQAVRLNSLRNGSEEGDQLCKVGDTLGVCSADGQCKSVAGLQDEKSWYEDAKWEDNCGDDYPICYDHFVREANASSHIARDDCRNQRSCKAGEANVVWMQYLRCKFGKNRTSTKPCQGSAQRLWMCHRCNRETTSLAIPVNGCFYNESYLQDGERCKHPNDTDGRREAFCFNKECYFLDQEISETNKPLDHDDCMIKKLQDAKEMKSD